PRGPLAVLSALAEDLQAAPAEQQAGRRYLALAHIQRPEDVAATRTALRQLGAHLRPVGSEVFRPVNDGRALFVFDLADLGWDEDHWRQVRQVDPYGLDHAQATSAELRARAGYVRSMAKCESAHVRADWFVWALTRPPLGGRK